MLRKRIAIIGRGLAGLTLGFRMAKAGFRPVLFGNSQSPDNASRCAQGIVCNKGLIFAESPLFRAKLQSLKTLESWLTELEKWSGITIPRTWIGVDEPYWDEVDFQKTMQRVYRGNFWGCYRPSHRGPESWSDGLPGFAQPAGFMHYPDDAWFDVHATLNALEQASERLGVVFREEVIHELRLYDDKIQLKLPQSIESYDHLVIAAGSKSLDLMASLGIECPKSFLVAGQSLVWAHNAQKQKTSRILVKGNLSLATMPHQTILGSSSWKPDPQQPYDVEWDKVQLLKSAEKAFGLPIDELPLIQSMVGTRIRFTDRMPALGIIPDQQLAGRVSILTGFYKNGLQLADLCSEQLLLDLTAQKLSEFGEAFHVSRFYRGSRRAPGSPPRHCLARKQDPC